MALKLLDELRFFQIKPSLLYCDNKATIKISENLVQHDCTSYVDVDRHFIKEKLEDKIISLSFFTSKNQTTYILTKGIRT